MDPACRVHAEFPCPVERHNLDMKVAEHGNGLKVFDVLRGVANLAPYDIPPKHDEVE